MKTRVGRRLSPTACANTVVPSDEVRYRSAMATVALKAAAMSSETREVLDYAIYIPCARPFIPLAGFWDGGIAGKNSTEYAIDVVP